MEVLRRSLLLVRLSLQHFQYNYNMMETHALHLQPETKQLLTFGTHRKYLVAELASTVTLDLPATFKAHSKLLISHSPEQDSLVREPLDEVLPQIQDDGSLRFTYQCTELGVYWLEFQYLEEAPPAFFSRFLPSLALAKKPPTLCKTEPLRVEVVERVEDQRYAFVRHVRLVNEATIREILAGVTSNIVKVCAVPVIENGHVLEGEMSEIIVNTEARRGERMQELREQLLTLDQKSSYLMIGVLRGNDEAILDVEDLLNNECQSLKANPELTAAYVFDSALQKFSEDFSNHKISACISAPYIESEHSLLQVLNSIRQEVINKLFLHEYFLANVAENVKELETFLKEGHPLNKELLDLAKSSLTFKTSDLDLLLRTMTGHGDAPYGVKVDIEFAACLLHDERKPRGQVLREFAWLLTQINAVWTQKVQEFLEEALQNIELELRYHRLKQRDIKVTKECPLVAPYFTKYETSGGQVVCLNSGETSMYINSAIAQMASTYWLRRVQIMDRDPNLKLQQAKEEPIEVRPRIMNLIR